MSREEDLADAIRSAIQSHVREALADAWDEGVTVGLSWDENRERDFMRLNPYRVKTH